MLYLVFVNGLGFLLMGLDKRRARRGEWRIPERALFVTAVAGGAAGVWAGMFRFRHKTLHPSFRFGMPVILFLQAGGLIWLGMAAG